MKSDFIRIRNGVTLSGQFIFHTNFDGNEWDLFLVLFLYTSIDEKEIINAHFVLFNELLPVFMCDEERSLDVTTIRILSLSIEHFFVMLVVVQIHGTVKCEQNYLWRLQEIIKINEKKQR